MQVPEVAVLVALEELRAQNVTAAPQVRARRALGVRALCVLTTWGPTSGHARDGGIVSAQVKYVDIRRTRRHNAQAGAARPSISNPIEDINDTHPNGGRNLWTSATERA